MAATAQDRIYKKNGEIIEAAVKTVNAETIVYKKYDNLKGPDYTLAKKEVTLIRYMNGTEEDFDKKDSKTVVIVNDETVRVGKKTFMHHRDIYSIAPIMITENGFGLGVSVEHFLDRAGWVSVYTPLIATFNLATSSYTDNPRMDPMFYLMPGMKIYTNMQSPRRTKYSVGPSLVVGVGRSTTNTAYYFFKTDPYTERTRFLLGAMVMGGINLFPTEHLYVGADFGIGLTYLNQYNGVNKNVVPLTQLSFRVGVRN